MKKAGLLLGRGTCFSFNDFSFVVKISIIEVLVKRVDALYSSELTF
jgi:hypothetical protein